MGGFLSQIGNVLSGGLVNKIVDKVIPDRLSPEDKAKFNQELEKALLEKETEIMKARSSIIESESKSEDPWVSRARPTFLWIMYFVIIFNYILIPLSGMICSSFGRADLLVTFTPIDLPSDMWNMFLYGYLGYVGFRSSDKSGFMKNLIKRK